VEGAARKAVVRTAAKGGAAAVGRSVGRVADAAGCLAVAAVAAAAEWVRVVPLGLARVGRVRSVEVAAAATAAAAEVDLEAVAAAGGSAWALWGKVVAGGTMSGTR